MLHVLVCVRERAVVLLSITFDNSGMPEAFAANIIKSVLCISVTQTTLKKDERPHVFAADASSQLEVSKCCLIPFRDQGFSL